MPPNIGLMGNSTRSRYLLMVGRCPCCVSFSLEEISASGVNAKSSEHNFEGIYALVLWGHLFCNVVGLTFHPCNQCAERPDISNKAK